MEKSLEKELESSDTNTLFSLAEAMREKISRKITDDPWTYRGEMRTWHALSYLLARLVSAVRSSGNSSKNLNHILKASAEVVRLKDEIDKLEKNQAKIVQVNDKKEFCLTEDFPLSFLPKNVEEEIQAAIGVNVEFFNQWTGKIRKENAELLLTQALAMDPAIQIVKSEIISRQLRFTYNIRLFPSLNSSKARKFVEMSKVLTKDLLFLFWDKLAANSVVRLGGNDVQSLREFGQVFSREDIDWYLNLMSNYIVHDPTENVFHIPFYTLKMLQLAVFKWSGTPQVGKGLDYIGKTVEELIFNLVQSFDAQTRNPMTGKSLLRVIDPDSKQEIADVLIYNEKCIVMIESKFWDCPHLQDLESELSKFEGKVDFFRNNLGRLGFPKTDIVPIFYTPFPPYSRWHAIQLVPSRFLIGMFLRKFFNPKKPRLVEHDERLMSLVVSEDYPFPYPTDASELNKRIEPNSRRIHDGCVVGYDENEVEIRVKNPLGYPFNMVLDIDQKTHDQLRKQGVSPGTLIRCGIMNLSGSWSISQLLHFEKIEEKNPERKIKEIWGNTTIANTIIEVFRKYGLDIVKFIEFCKKRAPNPDFWPYVVAARMGTVLFLADSFNFVTQCECGQILAFDKEMIESRKEAGGGRILCNSCFKSTTR